MLDRRPCAKKAGVKYFLRLRVLSVESRISFKNPWLNKGYTYTCTHMYIEVMGTKSTHMCFMQSRYTLTSGGYGLLVHSDQVVICSAKPLGGLGSTAFGCSILSGI